VEIRELLTTLLKKKKWKSAGAEADDWQGSQKGGGRKTQQSRSYVVGNALTSKREKGG